MTNYVDKVYSRVHQGSMVKHLVLAAMIATATGCASHSAAMQSFIGGPDTALLSAWGPPDQETSIADGRRFMMWWHRANGKPVCRLSFVISPEGRVIDGANGCPY